jgi:hypothetical protein
VESVRSRGKKRLPQKDKEANWLPAPKGAFNLTMRLYAQRSEAFTGNRMSYSQG